MYTTNSIAVFSNEFPHKDQDGSPIATNLEGKAVTTTLSTSQASPLLMLFMLAEE